MKQFKLNNGLTLVYLDKLSDMNSIQEYKEEIFDILTNAYTHINGCSIYKNVKHMTTNVYRYKLVFNNDNQLYAVATYRYFVEANSYKCILIGGNIQYNKSKVKEAVKSIIKSDIANFKNLYWIEASGPIMHWHNKFGAIKIPNAYVPAILGYDNITLLPDGYSYTRKIQGVENEVEKIMFGFPNKNILEEILSGDSYINYENTIKRLYNNETIGDIMESIYNKSRESQLIRILEFIIDSYTENLQFYNMTKNCHSLIKKVLIEIKSYISKNRYNKQRYLVIKDLYTECLEIYRNANILKLNKL